MVKRLLELLLYTNEGLDTGDILLKAEVPIADDMTVGELMTNCQP